jgi:hypothetical protein
MRTPTQASALAAIAAPDDELGQVLALLRAAGVVEPETLTVGEGDRLLLALHRDLTGADVEVAVECSRCETVNVAALSPELVPPDRPRCAWLGPAVGLRQPTYADLLRLPADPSLAEAELLARCSLGTAKESPRSEQLEPVDDALTGPIALECVECGERLEVAADVQRLVLEGLQRCALTLDTELHVLASTYGWSLAEIESLPDDRRRRLARLAADRP